MRLLLTGGSGFLGSALARHLLDNGHEVALLLRESSSLARLGDDAKRMQIGRCTDDTAIAAFVQDARPEAVIHTACSYGRHGEAPLQLLNANLRFGLVLLQAQQALGGERGLFINTSSALDPGVSAYALSKAQFAQWGALLARTGGPRFVNVRLQHMYGPGDDASKFSTHVLHACRANQPSLALTAGEQRRDFIFIDDVVAAYALLLRERAQLADADEVELGSGVAPTIREFVETVHALTHSSTELKFGALPYRPNEAMHCQADIGRLRAMGWAPRHDLRSGLQETLKREAH
jgi:nucleoside-diphosphate-sugar epimerase